jgi:alkylhydroperoxidase/carboxymuconolactone decarboxylase family protein YurZ
MSEPVVPILSAMNDLKQIYRVDPLLADAYTKLVHSSQSGALSPLVRQLVCLAAASVCSGIDTDAIRAHSREALLQGATFEELRSVIELVAVQGIHTLSMGIPIMLEEAGAAGLTLPSSDTTAARLAKEDFIKRRGYWAPVWEAIVAFNPSFLTCYVDFSAIPGEQNALEPKVRELIYIVINSVTTHLFPEGLRIHIRNAFKLGVRPEEIVEVFQIISTIGIRSALYGFPIIEDESTVNRNFDVVVKNM